MIAFFDGRFLDENEVKISPFCAGFMYGKGVFTTLKFADNKIQFLGEHISRIKSGLKYFRMGFSDYGINNIIYHLVDLNRLDKARIKIVCFENNNAKTSILIKVQELKTQPEFVTLKSDDNLKGKLPIYKYKTLNYFYNILSMQNAVNSNYDYSLFVSDFGDILETSYHNIFFIKHNEVFTPPDSLPLLPGIIRKKILEMKEINVIEQRILFDKIASYDAVFITNSISIAMPVLKINQVFFDLDLGIEFSEKIKKLISEN